MFFEAKQIHKTGSVQFHVLFTIFRKSKIKLSGHIFHSDEIWVSLTLKKKTEVKRYGANNYADKPAIVYDMLPWEIDCHVID